MGAPNTSILTLLSALLLAAPALGAAPPATEPPTPTVAVLYFDYSGQSEELGVLKKGLAQMLVSDLASADGVRLVERSRLEEVLAELKLGRTAAFDPATAGKVGKLLGAQFMVLGSYFALGGVMRADTRVVEVETGRVLHSTGASEKVDDFLALEQKLVKELSAFLAAGLPKGAPAKGDPPSPSPGAVRHAHSSPPPRERSSRHPATPAALRMETALRYSKALDALDHGKHEEAKAGLKAVVEAQPDFQLAALDLDKLMK